MRRTDRPYSAALMKDRRSYPSAHGLEKRGKPIVLPLIALALALPALMNEAVEKERVEVSTVQGLTASGKEFVLVRSERGLIREFKMTVEGM